MILPFWLQMILAPLNISPPIKIAVEGAYVVWKELPFLRQIWAMWHFKKAVVAAVRTDHPLPLEKFSERFGSSVGNAPQIKEEQ
jgi:hypothetical protein